MSFEFRRQGRVYFEPYDETQATATPSGNFYRLHTTREVSFSQTFKQEEIRERTLHNLGRIIEGSSIKEANPANFTFTMYLVDESSTYQHTPIDNLIQLDADDPTRYLKRFNLYFVYADYSPAIYYKIENCFVQSGSFKIPRNGLMTVEISGEGKKLTRNTGWSETDFAGFDSNPTYAVSKEFDVWVGGSSSSDKLDNVLGVSFEIQNNTNWTSNKNIHDSLQVTNASNTIFPTDFTLESRSMAGNISQYIDETNTNSKNNVLSWAENTTVHVKAGLSTSNYQLEITMDNNASFTNRAGFGEVFTQDYDFRLMNNSFFSWSNVIQY